MSGFWDEEFWGDLYINDHDSFVATFFIVSQILPPLNSALNPFIYAVFNTQFRIAYKAVLLRVCGNKTEFLNMNRRMTFFSADGAFKKSPSGGGKVNMTFKQEKDEQNNDQITTSV